MQVTIVTAGYDHKICFWDAGGRVVRTLPFADSQVNCMAMSPDRARIAVGGHAVVRIFDATPSSSAQAAIGAVDGTYLSGNVTGVFFLSTVAGGGPRRPQPGPAVPADVLLVMSEDGSIKAFSIKAAAAARGPPGEPAPQQQGPASALAVALLAEARTKVPITASALFPNHQLLVTGTQLGRVCVWHLPALLGLPGGVQTAGRLLNAAGSSDPAGSRRQADSQSSDSGPAATPTASGDKLPVQELVLEGDSSPVRSITVGACGNFVCVATGNGRVHCLVPCRGDVCVAYAPGNALRPLRPVRNSNPLYDQSLNPFALEQITFFVAHGKYVLSIAAAPNSRFLTTASADYSAAVWGIPPFLAAGRFISITDMWADSNNSGGGDVPTGIQPPAAAAGQCDTVSLVGGVANGLTDPRLAFPLRRTFVGHQRWVWASAISANSVYVLTVSSDHTGRMWKLDGDLVEPPGAVPTADTASTTSDSSGSSSSNTGGVNVAALAPLSTALAQGTNGTAHPPPVNVSSTVATFCYHNKPVTCCILDLYTPVPVAGPAASR